MAYEGLTLDGFKKKLKEGAYKAIGGARKGISRSAGWSKAEREEAEAIATKFFGAEPKGTKPVKIAKTADGAPKRRGRPPKNPDAVAAPKTPKAAKEPKAPKAAAGKTRGRKPSVELVGELLVSEIDMQVAQAGQEVKVVQDALTAMSEAKRLGAESTDVAFGALEAQHTLTAIVQKISGLSREIQGVIARADEQGQSPVFDEGGNHQSHASA